MSIEYTPPERAKVEYVAYTRVPKRFGNSETGEATDFRSSVFVREFSSVLVKSYENKSGEFHGETIRWGAVIFDAASLGMEGYKIDFGGQVEAGGEAAVLLERAHKEQKPVMVAIETIRRGKSKSAGDEIDCTDYVHDLRGAQADGQKGNSNMTGDNTKNRIVGVGAAGHPETFVFTSELTTDPTEWLSLRVNVDHTLPPAGWRIHKGGIIPSQNATAGGDTVDVDDLAARVAERLRPIMSGNSAGRPRPTQNDGFATESKEWEPWNSDGRVNLGGYLLAKERAVFAEAHRMVTEVDPTASVDEAWGLVPVLHWMADTVQHATYGAGARPNRTAKSHFEASKWAAYVYTTLAERDSTYAFTKDAVSDPAAQQVWAKAVVEAASGLYRMAATNVETHLTGRAPAQSTEPIPAPAPEKTHSAAPAAQGPEQKPEQGPAPKATSGEASDPQTTNLDEWINTAANPALVERYDGLLTTAGQAGNPERFHALLESQFGSWQMTQIAHDDFEKALAQWEADVDAFTKAAYAAWVAKPGDKA
ncbi:MAG: hypothetical protein L0H93_10455 [Nocardioides sp.]|nr:hypothetical protein [Nocardioides sp.]